MLDLKAWAEDAPLYYARLRSAAIPNGVAEYGDEPKGGGGKAKSKPPISLGALEAAERETVALWRVLAHYRANRPFDPYMRAQGRRVVGMKMCDEPEEIVSAMSEDVLTYLETFGGAVPASTLSFCHKARSQSKLIVGDLSRMVGPFVTNSEALAMPRIDKFILYKWRVRGRVEFEKVEGEFHYYSDSFNAAYEKLSTRGV